MPESLLFHDGNRALQDQFESRRIADGWKTWPERSSRPAMQRLHRKRDLLLSGDGGCQGRPDVSFKGGPAGFVRITAPDELAFPDYDGNGMFKSLGNVTANPEVGLLFIAMHGAPRRLRISGRASFRATIR